MLWPGGGRDDGAEAAIGVGRGLDDHSRVASGARLADRDVDRCVRGRFPAHRGLGVLGDQAGSWLARMSW